MAQQYDHKVHLYKRVKHKPNKDGVTPKDTFRCMLPNCPHYVTEPYVVNKLCVCYKCDTVFTLTPKLMSQRVRFKCSDCRNNIPLNKRKFKHTINLNPTVDNDLVLKPVTVDNKKVNQDVISEVLDSLFEGLKL